MRCSFLQFGEDLLIVAALKAIRRTAVAYYVDVGVFDPVVYSNTLLLSQAGWLEINIDPNPQTINKFNSLRPQDINLELAIAASQGEQDFFLYANTEDPTDRMATSDDNRLSLLGSPPESIHRVETWPLAFILDRHLPRGAVFGFLNIDCEGFDLEVLKSIGWSRYRPWVISVEDHAQIRESEIETFCTAQGYRFFAQAYVTKIFMRDD